MALIKLKKNPGPMYKVTKAKGSSAKCKESKRGKRNSVWKDVQLSPSEKAELIARLGI